MVRNPSRTTCRVFGWMAVALVLGPLVGAAPGGGDDQPRKAGKSGPGRPTSRPEPESIGRGDLTTATMALDPAVQAELKLTDAQRAKIRAAADAPALPEGPAAQGARPGMGPGPDDDRPAFPGFGFGVGPDGEMSPEAAAAVVNSVVEAQCARAMAVVRVLDRAQKARLRQFALQQEGPFALNRPDAATALRLKPAQVQRVRRILARAEELQAAALSARLSPPAPGPGGRPAPPAPTLEQVQAETSRQVDAVLTPEQRAAFRDLLGPPITLAKPKPTADQPIPPAVRDAIETMNAPQ
jgi:hypothetical protein